MTIPDSLLSMVILIREFIKLLLSRFFVHQRFQNAANLTFTTLLSLVPLMTIALAVFSAFPVAERIYEAIQNFVFKNFMPASGEVVQRYLEEFSAKASRLTGVGFLFLLLVALLLMAIIDSTLNEIWEVKYKRKLLNKFLVYWAILSLGPILIGISILATSYLISLPLLSEAAATGIGKTFLGLMPIMFSALGFGLMYALIPNCRVKGWHAAVGGLTAAVLFEVAKRAFALYVTHFPTYEAIYGALASIPIFLIWIYLSWLVVLLGAEFTYCLGIFRYYGTKPSGEWNRMEALVRLLDILAEAQKTGEACSEKALYTGQEDVESLLIELQNRKLVHRTEDGKWALARKPADVTLYEIYQKGRYRLPNPGEPGWPRDSRLADYLMRAHERLKDVLSVSLERIKTEVDNKE